MNRRQLAFVAEYSVDRNGAAAAVRAGYSVARAKQTASELMRRPDVVAELARVDAGLAVGNGSGDGSVTREWLLGEMLDYHVRGKRGGGSGVGGDKGFEELREDDGESG